MAKISAVSNLVDSLIGDTGVIEGLNVTPAQFISQFVTLAPPAQPVARITKVSCDALASRQDESKVVGNTLVDLSFSDWYYLTRYYAESMKISTTPYKVAMLASLIGGAQFLNAATRAYIITPGARIFDFYSGVKFTANFDTTLVGDKFNQTLLNGSNSFSFIFPTELNGTDVVLRLYDSTTLASAFANNATITDGIATITIDAQNPVTDRSYYMLPIFSIFPIGSYPFFTQSFTSQMLQISHSTGNITMLIGE